MLQSTSQKVSKIKKTNDDNLEQYLKYIENQKSKIQHQSEIVVSEVDNFKHLHSLLDKEITRTEYENLQLEKEILICFKHKAEHAAKTQEKIKWDIYKTELLKEFEQKQNMLINQQISQSKQQKQLTNPTTNMNDNKSDIDILEENCKELVKQIDERKKIIQMSDPNKLYTEIRMLENRNRALYLRYQRQVQEAEVRLRQANSELSSMHKILEETNALLLQ